MYDPDGSHTQWFADMRHILSIAEVTPGLPLPSSCATRCSFSFTLVKHGTDAAGLADAAMKVFAYGLRITFAPRLAQAGDGTSRTIFEGFMPSGFAVDIVARSEHVEALTAAAHLASAA